MRVFIDLNKEEDFKTFFEYVSDEEETDLYDLMLELNFNSSAIFSIDDYGETSWKKIPIEYLGNYFISIGSSYDRIGNISKRLCIKIENFKDVNNFINEITKTRKEITPIAKKIDLDREKKTFNTTKDDLNKYEELYNILYSYNM